jgi:hypothetical protein
MKTKIILPLLMITTIYLSSCQQNSSTQASESTDSTSVEQLNRGTTESNDEEKQTNTSGKIASAAQILARPQVPILCYHQVRNWTASDGKMGKDYIVPIAEFKSQMKMLADSGYQTILPDQLYSYLAYGTKLPNKPIMLTFDDTKLDQRTCIP